MKIVDTAVPVTWADRARGRAVVEEALRRGAKQVYAARLPRLLARRRPALPLGPSQRPRHDLAYASRAPQADIARLKAQMGWKMPRYTITDSFGVDEWHGHNVFFRDGDKLLRTYYINSRGNEVAGDHLELPRCHAVRPPGAIGGLARGFPPGSAYKWWN
jgi:uncharacterized protein DUF899